MISSARSGDPPSVSASWSSSARVASSRASSSSARSRESSVELMLPAPASAKPTLPLFVRLRQAYASCSLLVDSVEDAVHQTPRLPRRILLGEGDGLVDDGSGWDLAGVELMDRDPEDVPLDGPEPVGRPPGLGGGLGYPPVDGGNV